MYDPEQQSYTKSEYDALKQHLADEQDTIKHLRGKAEFDMPADMQGKFHNACTEPCDMVDGPCACGAWHNAKEWIGKLCKYIKQLQAQLTHTEADLKCRTDELAAILESSEAVITSLKAQLTTAKEDKERKMLP